jgi:hypothetical protein
MKLAAEKKKEVYIKFIFVGLHKLSHNYIYKTDLIMLGQ